MCAKRVTSPPRRPITERFSEKYQIDPRTGCWNWTACKDKHGYGHISLGGKHGGHALAHRVSYEIHVGQIPDGIGMLHSCDNPACVKPDHLILGTHTENMRDCVSRGRKNPAFGDRHGSKTHPESTLRGDQNPMRKHPELVLRGSANGAAKITEPMAREVKRLLACGATQREVSRETGVGYHTVHKISKGEQWKHVEINQSDLKAAA